jgi:hypothetical protein
VLFRSGNVYEVTVIPNGSLWNGSQRGYSFTQHDSSYGILATIEQLFGLSWSLAFNRAGGVCWNGQQYGHNLGCLDTLWQTDPSSDYNYNPMLTDFTYGSNGFRY